MLERATGAARAAESAVARRNALRQQLAQAAPEAATAANVQDDVGATMNTLAQHLEVWRPPFVALICTLVGIFGAFWIVAILERVNPLSVLSSGWADERHRIEDLRGKDVVDSAGRRRDVEPMEPPREVVTDADTGEELIKVKPREYWRKRVKTKGKPTRVDIEPDPVTDEVGVTGYATGRVDLPNGEGVMVMDDAPQTEPAPEAMSDDEAAELLDDLGLAEPDDDSEHNEPQTDPSRLIAAE